METVTEQDQTAQSEEVTEEVQAGEEQQAVETAATETEEGLLKESDSDGLSVEDIMSEGEVEKVPGTPHGVQKKIDKEVSRRKEAENRAEVAEKQLAEAKTIQNAPTERPLAPLREDFETGAEYQAEFVKYEESTIAYNDSQVAINDREARVNIQREKDIERFNAQAVRLRQKFPNNEEGTGFDQLVATNNPDGSNPFGNIADLVLSAEFSAPLGIYLRKNPSKMEELQNLDRNSALLAIGELSGKFKTVQKKTTGAPKVLSTIKEGSDTPVTNIYDIKDNNEFLKKRNEEIRRKRKQPG